MNLPLAVPPARAGGQLRPLRHGWSALAAIVIALLAMLVALATPAAAQTFPKFTGFVVDAADVLPPDVEADLMAKLDALQRDTKRQLVVATVPSLEGYPIEEYGYKLGREWGVGLADVDNGAILLIAPNDRKVRIEVGRGLEPFITDAFSSVTINQDILPQFKAGNLSAGIVAGTDAMIAQLRASPEEAQARLDAAVKKFDATNASARKSGGTPIGLIFWGMVLVFVMLSLFRRRGAKGQRYRDDGGLTSVVLWNIAANVASAALRGNDDNDWGGGGGFGGGGGGWGGGGFGGGGGGSFGGGGASGSW